MAKNTTDIKDLYKRRGAQKRIRQLVIFLLLAVAVYFIYEVTIGENEFTLKNTVSNFFDSVGGSSQFPVETQGSKVIALKSTKNSLVFLDESSLYVYSLAGKNRQTISHGYYKPALETNASRILIYDAGGTNAVISSENKELFTYKFDQKILTAKLGDKNYAVFITDSEKASEQGFVYNENNELIYNWFNEKPVTAFAFSEADNTMAVAAVETAEGELLSKVSIHKFYSDKVDAVLSFSGELVLDIQCLGADNNFYVVTDKNVHRITTGGLKTATYSFGGEALWAFSTSGQNCLAVALGNYTDRRVLNVYRLDLDLNVKGPVAVREHLVELKSDNKNIYILTENILYKYDSDMTLADIYETPDARSAQAVGKTIYYASAGKLDTAQVGE